MACRLVLSLAFCYNEIIKLGRRSAMNYRMLGNTGIKVSEIGYGGEYL